jgi:hypothetical protein
MDRTRFLGIVSVSALALGGCEKPTYSYADDVKVQYSDGEKVASIKAQLGCEGANPTDESAEDKKAREARIPHTPLGKSWLKKACEIADAFDAAATVTTWPADKGVYAGPRICRPQISRVLGDPKEDDKQIIDETVFARMGRVEIAKGSATGLWPEGPAIDQKDKILGYTILFTDVAFKVTEKKLPDIEAFFAKLDKGEKADVEELRKDESPDDRKTTDEIGAIVGKHNVPGILLTSDGKSVLAYPVLHTSREPGAGAAIHYLRQQGDKLLVVSPMLGASQPSACVAELTLQK